MSSKSSSSSPTTTNTNDIINVSQPGSVALSITDDSEFAGQIGFVGSDAIEFAQTVGEVIKTAGEPLLESVNSINTTTQQTTRDTFSAFSSLAGRETPVFVDIEQPTQSAEQEDARKPNIENLIVVGASLIAILFFLGIDE